jgi:AAA+ ATPase superfamily predicted ATPase
MKIIGRKDELELLKRVKENTSSSFVAVYGRIRVGETFLIREAFDFYVTGLFKVSLTQQLINFHVALLKYDPHAEGTEPAKDWRNKKRGRFALFLNSKVLFLIDLNPGPTHLIGYAT